MERGGDDWTSPDEGSDVTIDDLGLDVEVEDLGPDISSAEPPRPSSREEESVLQKAKRLLQVQKEYKSGKRKLKTQEIAEKFGKNQPKKDSIWQRMASNSRSRKAQTSATRQEDTRPPDLREIGKAKLAQALNKNDYSEIQSVLQLSESELASLRKYPFRMAQADVMKLGEAAVEKAQKEKDFSEIKSILKNSGADRAAAGEALRERGVRSRDSSLGESSEDEDTRDLRRISSKFTPGRQFRYEDEASERERQSAKAQMQLQDIVQTYALGKDAKRMKELEAQNKATWEENEKHYNPYVSAIDESIVDVNNTFYVMRYETQNPLGVKTTHYRVINNAEEWNALQYSIRMTAASQADQIRLILKTDPDADKIIVPDKNTPRLRWIPVEVAVRRIDATTEKMRSAVNAIESELITPRLIYKYDESGKIERLEQLGSTQEKPKESDGVLHLNVPQDQFSTLAIGPRDIIMSTVDGIPTIRDICGGVIIWHKNAEKYMFYGYNDELDDWPLTTLQSAKEIDSLRRISHEECERILEIAQDRHDSLRKAKKAIVNLNNQVGEKVDMIEAMVDQVERLNKKVEELELQVALARSEDPKEDSPKDPLGAPPVKVDPKEDQILTLKEASNNKMLMSTIELWGKSGNTAARPWLKAAMVTCQQLKVNEDIVPQFLTMRLKATEKIQMAELLGEGKITDIPSFVTQFLEKYGKKQSPLNLLRTLLNRKMTVHEVQTHDYYSFAHALERDAHEAYFGLGLTDRDLWPVVDKIVVVSAFLSAVPSTLSNHLMLEDVETLEAAAKESRKWATSLVDSGGRAALAAVVGNAQAGNEDHRGNGGRDGRRHRGGRQQANQQQEQPRQEPNAGAARQDGEQEGEGQKDSLAALCRNCKEATPRPDKCRHCKFCLVEGHRMNKCWKLAQKKKEEKQNNPG